MSTSALPSTILTLRPALPEDEPAVRRLAQLDSAPVPVGSLLLAEVNGTPVAALSVETGVVIADPFARTADLIVLLRNRADRLQGKSTPLGARRLRAWLRPARRSATAA